MPIERTGRGRLDSDYTRSHLTTVVVDLGSAKADIPFLQIAIAEEERTGIRMPLDSLIVLARLRRERRLDVQTVASAIQKNESVARAMLERLVEGLSQATGTLSSVHTEMLRCDSAHG